MWSVDLICSLNNFYQYFSQVFTCSVKNNEGVEEAMKWLVESIQRNNRR